MFQIKLTYAGEQFTGFTIEPFDPKSKAVIYIGSEERCVVFAQRMFSNLQYASARNATKET